MFLISKQEIVKHALSQIKTSGVLPDVVICKGANCVVKHSVSPEQYKLLTSVHAAHSN